MENLGFLLYFTAKKQAIFNPEIEQCSIPGLEMGRDLNSLLIMHEISDA
jgi:hypothetical protein